RDDEAERRERFGIVAGEAQRHHAAERTAGEIDAVGIGDAALHQFADQRPDESDVVRDAAEWAKECNLLGRHLSRRKEIPAQTAPFREGHSETVSRSEPAEPALLRLLRRADPRAVQHDDGRTGARYRGPLEQHRANL